MGRQRAGGRERRTIGVTRSQATKPRGPMACTGACLLLAFVAASALGGCGSTTTASPGVPQATSQVQSPPAQTASTSAAAPSTSGPPSFIVNATTQEGDKVKVEGRFGPPLPVSESDVDQTALSECPPPAPDGRAVIVRLDLTTTLESNLSGEVGLVTSFAHGRTVNFVMGFSQGARCDLGEPGNTSVNLGSLQPQQSANFTMWVVLPDAVTPENPQPSTEVLGNEGWFMETPQPTVNGSGFYQDRQDNITGPRVVKCQNNEEAGKYITVIGSTPKALTEQNIKDYDEVCP